MPKSKFDFTAQSLALASDEFQLSIPIKNILAEACSIADFVRKHHKADKKSKKPGLADANISLDAADEIEALVAETAAAQWAWTLSVDPKADRAKLERARFIVDEIYAVMEYFLDDGVENEEDTRFHNVVAAHKDESDTPAALALALEEYAALASLHADAIDGLGGFDVALLDEAKTLADQLRKSGPSAPPSAASAAALAKRNRLLQLLDARVRPRSSCFASTRRSLMRAPGVNPGAPTALQACSAGSSPSLARNRSIVQRPSETSRFRSSPARSLPRAGLNRCRCPGVHPGGMSEPNETTSAPKCARWSNACPTGSARRGRCSQ